MYARKGPLPLCVLCDSPSRQLLSANTQTKIKSPLPLSSYKEARSLWLHKCTEKYFSPQREPSPPPKDNSISEKNCNFLCSGLKNLQIIHTDRDKEIPPWMCNIQYSNSPEISWSRIHEQTILLRFLGMIILRVLRLVDFLNHREMAWFSISFSSFLLYSVHLQ
jgi:hypothetical protein